mmetsp:Transcript_16429/g.44312  ORF Transcript_16429/g.44312 Transcript_16429/m.44312 type:complete len:210 (+) Transcript_16429:97-726(+)
MRLMKARARTRLTSTLSHTEARPRKKHHSTRANPTRSRRTLTSSSARPLRRQATRRRSTSSHSTSSRAEISSATTRSQSSGGARLRRRGCLWHRWGWATATRAGVEWRRTGPRLFAGGAWPRRTAIPWPSPVSATHTPTGKAWRSISSRLPSCGSKLQTTSSRIRSRARGGSAERSARLQALGLDTRDGRPPRDVVRLHSRGLQPGGLQ